LRSITPLNSTTPISALRSNFDYRHTYAVSEKNPPSFGRSGRPRKLNLSDLFLWDPRTEFELAELSVSKLLAEKSPKMLGLFQDLGRKRKISDERARGVIPSLGEAIDFPLADVASLGLWQCYFYSLSYKAGGEWPPRVSPLGRRFIEIEEALKEPTLAWQRDDMARCADLLESSSVLAAYLWPEVVFRLRNATSVEEVTSARAMVMLELYLSAFAYQDAQIRVNGHAGQSMFGDLFPDFSAENIDEPNALFFDWLETYTGTKHKLASFVHQISKPAADADIESSKRQLRRWKQGNGFPSYEVLDALFRNLYADKAKDEKDWALSWSMATATKRINFLMPILAPLSRFREGSFPFDHDTIQEWRKERYLHWYMYWLPLLEKQT